ncbi:unnamed protein product [marine sediment metagenome]|uniref:Uncharacterized protein n=1 Tax=marine sediment metagenome TaxID=412755 RepID=X0Z3P9_9ZZZZ
MHLNGTLHVIHDTWEFHQEPITGCLYEAASMRGEFWVNNLIAVCFLVRNRTFLVEPHEPRVANHIK